MASLEKARAHHAKQTVMGERDRLLAFANKRIDTQKYRPADGKDRARAVVWSLPLLLGPVFAFSAVVIAWFFLYHSSIVMFSALVMTLLLVSVGLSLFSFKWISGKERPWLWWAGFFTGQAVFAALVVGFFVYYHYLAYYWKYEEMRTYTNVAAAQDDESFIDGSMFLWTEDTRLDTQRAVGYKSKWTGQTYCVAPLVDTTMSTEAPIYYWAIGEDCCDARSDFQCGDAEDGSTRSALVALEPADVVRPYMRWAVRGSAYDRYLKAVRLEEATYMTKAADNPTFVYWSKDPLALKDSFYTDGVNLCVKVSLCYMLFLMVCVYVVCLLRLVPKQRIEGVIRAHHL
eukprot:TRINITY_DN24074_c0_g1_i1.p1 TRINITY_DN24074_c0_g1~~TRINITY_DN24074_c0_g1_i1.p1  ORF type:complete len:344 (-),score=44.16 TRINITY_DN24074_c0_g1_i1:90-1121(-)